MAHDPISNWLEKAKSAEDATPAPRAVRVIRRDEPLSTGAVILNIAEKIRPWLKEKLDGVRDRDNRILQPAQIHAIALNVAQSLLKEEEEKSKKANA